MYEASSTAQPFTHDSLVNHESELARAELLFKPLIDVGAERMDEAKLVTRTSMWLADIAVNSVVAPTGEQNKLADDKWRAKVTEESLQEAEPCYSALKEDVVVQSAIDEYAARTGRYQDREVMAGLRHDAQLRLAVGVRLLDKIDNYTHMIRIGNGEKAPSARGYEKMTSKDYVASLVLAMADGTFKSNESDAIVTNNVGVATAGLHRTAALDVLRGDFKNL